jgi:hypothetical protein
MNSKNDSITVNKFIFSVELHSSFHLDFFFSKQKINKRKDCVVTFKSKHQLMIHPSYDGWFRQFWLVSLVHQSLFPYRLS